jgi:hypothetical protein
MNNDETFWFWLTATLLGGVVLFCFLFAINNASAQEQEKVPYILEMHSYAEEVELVEVRWRPVPTTMAEVQEHALGRNWVIEGITPAVPNTHCFSATKWLKGDGYAQSRIKVKGNPEWGPWSNTKQVPEPPAGSLVGGGLAWLIVLYRGRKEK